MMDIKNLKQNSIPLINYQTNTADDGGTKSLIYFPEDKNEQKQHNSSNIIYQMRPSTIGYLEYRKKANDRLSELNNGMSDLIKNSISGIDTICNKVRECLSEMEHRAKIGNQISCKTIMDHHDNEAGDVGDIIDETSVASSVDDAATELIEEYDHIDEAKPSPTNIMCTNPEPEKLKSRENMFKIIEEFTKCYENFDGIVQSIINDVHSKIERFSTSHMNIINSFKTIPNSLDKYKEKNNTDNDVLQIFKTKHVESTPTIQSDNSTASTVLPDSKTLKKPFKKIIKSKTIKIVKPPICQNSNSAASRIEIPNPPTRSSQSLLIPLEPQVYRKRGLPDINKILHKQIKANDSLIGFINLMNRKRFYRPAKNTAGATTIPKSTKSITKPTKIKSRLKLLNKEYSNSLWFSKSSLTPIQVKSAASKSRSRKNSKKSRGSAIKLRENVKTAPSLSSQNKVQLQSFNNLAESVKCKLHWMRNKIQQQSRKHKYLEYCDILDDISHKDLIPIKSEYPRRDNIGTECQELGKSYLYHLVYDKGMKSAIQTLCELPSSRKGIRKRKIRYRVKNKLNKNINDKIEDNTTNWEKIDIVPKISACETKSVIEIIDESEKLPEEQIKTPSIKSLLPYMIDPDRIDYNQSLCVMPVRVFYDNFNPMYHHNVNKSSSPPTRDHNRNSKNITSKMNNVAKPPLVRRKSTIESTKSDSKKSSPGDRTHTISIINRSSNQSQKADCKMWRTICGKTPAEQLISFIDSQDTPVRLPSKKAKFNSVTHSSLEGNKVPDFVVCRKLHPRSQPKPQPQKTPRKETPRSAKKLELKTHKASKVLDHLQTIKNRNQMIQDNIQKTINVIEEKMIDILSCPMTSSSGEAFNEMERQISHVLSLMNNSEERIQQNTKLINNKVQSFEKCPKTANNISNSIIKERKHKVLRKKEAKKDEVKSKELTSSSEEKCVLSSFIAPGQYKDLNKMLKVNKSSLDNKISESPSNASSPQGDSLAENKSDPLLLEVMKPTNRDHSKLNEAKSFLSPKVQLNGDCIPVKCETPSKHSNEGSLSARSDLRSRLSNCEHRSRLLTLSKHVDKALAKVEDVYKKLNDDKDFDTLEELMDESSEISEKHVRFSSNKELVEDKNSENTIIEPLMKEIRRARKRREDEKAKLEKIEKTPSCYNILTFLDTLTDRRDVPTPIQKVTMIYYCRVIYTPQVYAKTTITEWVNYLCSPQSCWFNSKRIFKKRVSFQLEKIDRNSQADLDIYPMVGIEACDPQQEEHDKKVELKRKLPEIGSGEHPTPILEDIPKRNSLLEGFYNKNVMNIVKEETADPKSDSKNFLRYFRIYLKQPSLLKPLTNVNTTVYKRHKLIKKEIKRKCKRVQKKHGLKDEEYATLLRVFYSIVFVVIFSGFTFNIKCVS